jgi:Chloramphenicol acetyltransferase
MRGWASKSQGVSGHAARRRGRSRCRRILETTGGSGEHTIEHDESNRYAAAGRIVMPVFVAVHHALADGLHVGRFVEGLQGKFGNSDASLGG